MSCLKKEGSEVLIILFFTQKSQFRFKQLMDPEITQDESSHFLKLS